jgi:uncharacterized protein (TIGR04255 family)
MAAELTRNPLPEFRNPPVVEVALSVQFEALARLSLRDVAELWNEALRLEFSSWRQAPPLPAVFEWFGLPRSATPSLSFTLSLTPGVEVGETPLPRSLFVNEDETALVQVQSDRFTRNWRKTPNLEYPRYRTIRESFRGQFEAFCALLMKREVGRCVANQCEVTYVNHIPWGGPDQPPDDLASVLVPWSGGSGDGFLGKPEADLTIRYVIGDAQSPVGRLHVAANPSVRREDQQPLLALILTARGCPSTRDIAGVMGFLDLGHEQVVRGFASITTAAMHQRWGRIV